jgi:hypothetical protein
MDAVTLIFKLILPAVTPLLLGVIAYVQAQNKSADDAKRLGQEAVDAAIALTQQLGGDPWARYLQELDALALAAGLLLSPADKAKADASARLAIRAAGLTAGAPNPPNPAKVTEAASGAAVTKVNVLPPAEK